MFIPEYTITTKILKNISNIEYGKAIIENTAILPNWQRQLEKEARIRTVFNGLQIEGIHVNKDSVKKFVDGISDKADIEIKNLDAALSKAGEISKNKDLDEEDLKIIHSSLSNGLLSQAKQGIYRSKKISDKTDPEEILAELVGLMDWHNSLDSRDSHSIIVSAILKAKLETISPFEQYNKIISNLSTLMSLKSNGYEIKGYYCLEDFYNNSKHAYEQSIASISRDSPDFTQWIEYFTEGMAHEISNIKEKINLLARDTKVAKVAGRTKLTFRQERIIEHLQDYGILRNSDFPKLFPDISEDSILRDLKVLMTESIVVKNGSTKSSMYELR